MSMSLKEFGLLRRLMARTTSGTDGEVLESIRHANAMLARHGLTWDKVFDRTVTVIDEVEDAARTEVEGAERIDEIFEFLSERKRRGKFVDDVRDQWERRRYLHPNAVRALEAIYDEEKGGR